MIRPENAATRRRSGTGSFRSSQDPAMIRVFYAYGREMFITKQVWRDSVLLDHLKKVWNVPNDLYSTIVQALQDGLGADMIKPAEQLAAIDPDAERDASVLSIVYREQNRISNAEKVLRRHTERHGESEPIAGVCFVGV